MEHTRIDFRDQIASNKRKSAFLMIIIFAVIILFGYVISMALDPGYFFFIMIIAIVFSIFYVVFSYYNSDKISIASVRAKPASREHYKDYYRLVEGLTIASGLPMPKLYIIDDGSPNAFATGRNKEHAVVAVTTGLLQILDNSPQFSYKFQSNSCLCLALLFLLHLQNVFY